MVQATATGKWVVFKLGVESYAVPIEHVMTIEVMKPITRMPETPQHVLGMINLRGEVLPVISMRDRLGMEKREQTDQTRIIVLHFDGHLLGCEVDAVEEVVSIAEDQIQHPALLGCSAVSLVRGVAKLAGQLLVLLDHRNLIVLT